jgi:hypothetical protein
MNRISESADVSTFLLPRAGGVLPEEISGRVEIGSPHESPPAQKSSDLDQSQLRANLLEGFLHLTQVEHMTATAAARALGRSPSFFSGRASALRAYQRDGLAGLAPAPRDGSASVSDLTRQIEAVPWFIPAARYYYLNTNLTVDRGSLREAVMQTISLPVLPLGWTRACQRNFLRALGLAEVPECPEDIRAAVQARDKAGRAIVPPRVARQIIVAPSIVRQHRSPRAHSLDTLTAPGSQRRYFNADAGERQIMQAGDWFGGDDATPGIAVCVPCSEVNTPCSQKYGVLLGRFQWLAYHDCRTDKLLAHDYVVRPRGSYRAEDVVNGIGMVTRAWGIPRRGWQLEGGTFNALLVRHCLEMLGVQHWRTYSPHQKAIESIFNRVWTRLALQFPHADMGRYREENEANCAVYEACKRGNKDPRQYFPALPLLLSAFDEEVTRHNTKRIVSEQYGQWVPDELFGQSVLQAPLRPFSAEMDYIFRPFAVERKVRGMLVRCRVPMFEDFSVPYEFHASWMPMHDGKRVRIHFDPRDPKAVAKVILLEASGDLKPNTILGDAQLIGETAGHIRLVMGWADDDQRAGYIARQRTANFLRRETRAILGKGARLTASEARDGLGQVTKVETSAPSATEPEASASSRAAVPVPAPVPAQRSPSQRLRDQVFFCDD